MSVQKVAKVRPLTAKQQRFVEEYLIDLNATQAAIRAGYSSESARQIAADNLSKPNISHVIEVAKAQRAAKAAVDAEMVLIGLKEVAERCLQAKPVLVFDRVKREFVPALDEEGRTVYEFDSQGANRAFELMGKHIGMFVERKEITGRDGGPIQLEAMTTEQREQRIQELLEKRKQELNE